MVPDTRSPDFVVRFARVDPKRIKHRICFNPNYGGPGTSVPGTCYVPIRTGKKGIKPETRERIRLSVEREGFRNPILVYNTPQGMLLAFGGGRLQAALELDVNYMPAIVVDYTDEFSDRVTVEPDNWREFFEDPPQYFEFTDVGVQTHYGLESGRRGEFDPAGVAWATDEDRPALLKESPWLIDNGYD